MTDAAKPNLRQKAKGAAIVEVGDKKVIVAGEGEAKGLAVARPMNRAERRRFEREQGNRGTKAKRRPSGEPQVPPEVQAAMAKQEQDERLIQSAQNIRAATSGRFWLPGDQ